MCRSILEVMFCGLAATLAMAVQQLVGSRLFRVIISF